MQVVGYADTLSVEPGAEIGFMISSRAPSFRADVIRLLHGDANPAGPGFKSQAVESDVSGEHPGRVQVIRPGSYVRVPHDPALEPRRGFTLQLWIQATTPGKEHQTLIAKTGADGGGYELWLDAGRLSLSALRDGRSVAELSLGVPVVAGIWYFVAAVHDAGTGESALHLHPLPTTASELAGAARAFAPSSGDDRADRPQARSTDLLVGARAAEGGDNLAERFYNGKIDSPRLYGRALEEHELARLRDGADPTEIAGLVAAWDFSLDISSSKVSDVSGNRLDGRTVQRPARAVTGRNWDGSESAWIHAPEQYGAIHFHDDDLDDAGWERSLRWTVPEHLESGVYALHLGVPGGEDDIPFVVRPKPGKPSARILLILPTFSYLAYGNEHLLGSAATIKLMAELGVDPETLGYPSQPQDAYVLANRLNSLYDSHSDGSGVFYSTRLRPVVNMRPRYFMQSLDDGRGSPHQFNADLHLVDWLHEQGYAFDVITDEDLYRDGLGALEGYRVVLTGTHHEYWAERMLDALEAYLDGGGRLMYLAGNGFYWVTELDPERGHTIEIRRQGPSTRSWDAAPGEGHLGFTGELGGLWRYRNRAPQKLVGVGFTAQGTGAGRPYVRQSDSFDPRASFVFHGVGDDELIGDHPCLVSSHGAAGFEIDRVDHSLGTPQRTLLLATASGFSDSYQHVSEEVLVSSSRQGGTVNELVRADMVLLEYPNGGAVFSPGSITWCGSLSYNDYENNVSSITRNVLDRFAADGRAIPEGRT